ncbi:MAG: hypothetical protein HDT16_03090 [Oscillibacter sp.]|nr:hypothetical protein [Oscillibacter sp.]
MGNKESANTSKEREYSPIEAVPQEARHIGFLDLATTWAGTSLQPSVWTLAGITIGLGFVGGIAATVASTVFVYILIGLFGLMTYYVGTSTMGLARFTMGIRGSKLISVASIVNSVGWSVVANYMAAITYSYVFNMLFGTPVYGAPGCEWILVIGCLLNSILSYLAISIGGTRSMKLFQYIMMIGLIILSIVLYIVIMQNLTVEDIRNFIVPDEMKGSIFGTFDTMVAILLTIFIIGGDLGRNVKSKTSALWAPLVGGVFSLLLFVVMGQLGIILEYKTTGIFNMDAANPSSLAMSAGLGFVALVVVLFATVTTNMMDVFTMSYATENLVPKLGYNKSVMIAGILPMLFCWLPVAVGSFIDAFYVFADILGIIFPSMLVIMLMDYYVINKREYDIKQIDTIKGKYWYTNGFNKYAISAWLLGAVVYLILHNILMLSFFSNVVLTMIIDAIIYYVMVQIAKKQQRT